MYVPCTSCCKWDLFFVVAGKWQYRERIQQRNRIFSAVLSSIVDKIQHNTDDCKLSKSPRLQEDAHPKEEIKMVGDKRVLSEKAISQKNVYFRYLPGTQSFLMMVNTILCSSMHYSSLVTYRVPCLKIYDNYVQAALKLTEENYGKLRLGTNWQHCFQGRYKYINVDVVTYLCRRSRWICGTSKAFRVVTKDEGRLWGCVEDVRKTTDHRTKSVPGYWRKPNLWKLLRRLWTKSLPYFKIRIQKCLFPK